MKEQDFRASMETLRENRVQKFYNQDPLKERNRLERDAYHSIESEITKRFIQNYLKPGMQIADIGCGAGHYSLWLMEQKYRVFMADLSSGLVTQAKQEMNEKNLGPYLIGAEVKNAAHLEGIQNNLFDMTLSFGPFYHLLSEKERVAALQELKRITKPSGLIFIATINRLCPIRDMMHAFTEEWANDITNDFDQTLKTLETGIYRNESEDPKAFTDAYFAKPDEIPALFEQENIEHVQTFSCEGIAAFLDGKAELLKQNPKTWKNFIELVYLTSTEPSIIGSGEHTVYIGRVR